jgi:hypothetical protein
MKPLTFVATAALVTAAAAGVAPAQDTMASKPFFQPPVFVILPSFLTTNVISAPEGVDSHTAFNGRFQAVVPTSSPYLAFVGGVQWGFRKEDHPPIGFLGGILPLVPLNKASGGWLSFSVDPLYVVTPGAEGGTEHDFVAEGAVLLNIGSMMMSNMPFWSGLSAFFLLDQNLTPNEDANGDKDYWNPVLIYGLAIPIAPWPGGSAGKSSFRNLLRHHR